MDPEQELGVEGPVAAPAVVAPPDPLVATRGAPRRPRPSVLVAEDDPRGHVDRPVEAPPGRVPVVARTPRRRRRRSARRPARISARPPPSSRTPSLPIAPGEIDPGSTARTAHEHDRRRRYLDVEARWRSVSHAWCRWATASLPGRTESTPGPAGSEGPGRGRRTYVHVEGMDQPIVASRSERAIRADIEAALNEAAGIPRRTDAEPRGRTDSSSAHLLGLRPAGIRGYDANGVATLNRMLRISELLRHHADLLRQRRAPSGPRLLDDRRRHPRPAPPPARRGRLLPHGHRRARRAGHPGGRSRGGRPRASSATATRRASRSWRRRSTPRTTSSSGPPTRGIRSGSRRSSSASTTTATSTRAPTRAGTAPAAPTSRPSRRSSRATAARSTRSS